ncbi:hypothetical protein ACH5RR_039407 [Cinchona calisaya]|uniref:Uncharacterized protein n=1 Tax=Cinchona calisaya TaxID=153742 RepID=A0ABD2Y3J7_9GENT
MVQVKLEKENEWSGNLILELELKVKDLEGDGNVVEMSTLAEEKFVAQKKPEITKTNKIEDLVLLVSTWYMFVQFLSSRCNEWDLSRRFKLEGYFHLANICAYCNTLVVACHHHEKIVLRSYDNVRFVEVKMVEA